MAPRPMNAIFIGAFYSGDGCRLSAVGKNKNGCRCPTAESRYRIPNSRSIETLRHALQRERGSFSNCPREARPFARSSRGWVRGGHVTEGSRSTGCSVFKDGEIKKGRYAPLFALRPNCCVGQFKSAAQVEL